jgi:hypothetical protein
MIFLSGTHTRHRKGLSPDLYAEFPQKISLLSLAGFGFGYLKNQNYVVEGKASRG